MLENYIENCCLQAPGLAIGTDTTTAKTGNTFAVKCNGILSAPKTTADCPALTLSKGFDGVVTGAKAIADDMCRIYTLLATVSLTTGAITFSWVNGDDFTKSAPAHTGAPYKNGGDGKTAIVGFLYIKNETGVDFIPGTTNLNDTTGDDITARYSDRFGYAGM